jgi:poly(glycerol-phosphate) alpha-glucosyltransferase
MPVLSLERAHRQVAVVSRIDFPDANYFLATSRLIPGLDGGYTVSVLRRALDFAEVGGVQPTLLTFDFRIDYDELIARFVELGLATSSTILRNLLTELRADPAVLRTRAAANGVLVAAPQQAGTAGPGDLTTVTDVDAAGLPWRSVVSRTSTSTTTGTTSTGTTSTGASGANAAPTSTVLYTDFSDLAGAPLFRLPYISGRADWHRADILIDVFGHDGQIVGQLRGFGELYRVWLDYVIETSPPVPSIVVVEARQVGELLGEDPDRSYKLVHTIHNAHTSAPHLWDSPMDDSWVGWFATTANYDAVVWLTEAQKADAERRFGPVSRSVVIPHPAAAPSNVSTDVSTARDVNLAVMVTRLVDQKRVDHAIAAWPAVLAKRPNARLDIYGDGPLKSRLQARIDELGVGAAVTLRGYTPNASDALSSAAALVVSSNYEGQPLVVLEALARGCPVVAYDVSYGLADMVEPDVTGELVPAGDIPALAEAISRVLGDVDRVENYSANAIEWARTHGAEESMGRTAELFQALLA